MVKQLLDQTGLKTLSDYGAGKCNLQKGLHDLGKRDFAYLPYDPAFPDYGPPKPAQLVCCIDVLEHIEEPYLEAVLLDLKDITRNIGCFSVHTGPAVKTLPDGRNAHIIQKPGGCRGFASISRSATCNAAPAVSGSSPSRSCHPDRLPPRLVGHGPP